MNKPFHNGLLDEDRFYCCRISTVLRILDEEEQERENFKVISHIPQRHAASRPLLILIHPGDLLEYPENWNDPEERQAVMRFAQENMRGTAAELKEYRKKHADIAVLHSGSSAEFVKRTRFSRSPLWAEIKRIHKTGSILFGTDLEAAGQWIIDNLHIRQRPHIHLAGAYSSVDAGCVTTIGKAIKTILLRQNRSLTDLSLRLTVSPFSPPCIGPGAAWRPVGDPLPMPMSAELKQAFDLLSQPRNAQ